MILWSLDVLLKTTLCSKSLKNIIIIRNLSPGEWQLLLHFTALFQNSKIRATTCISKLSPNLSKSYTSGAFDIFRLNMSVTPQFCALKPRNSVLFSLHCLFSSELFSQPKPLKSNLLLSYCSELLQGVILVAIGHPELCPWFKRPARSYAVTCWYLAWNLTCLFLQATKKTYFIKSLRLERTFKTIELNC